MRVEERRRAKSRMQEVQFSQELNLDFGRKRREFGACYSRVVLTE